MESDSNTHTTVIKHDQPVRVEIGESGDGRWFRMFHAVIESGAWSRLTSNTCVVYAVLAKHSDDQWVSWPSVQRISQLAGVSKRAVYRAISELQENGLLVLQRKKGGRGVADDDPTLTTNRGRPNVYQLVEPPILKGDKTAPLAAPQGCQNRHVKGDKSAPRIRLSELDSSSGAARRSGAQKTARRGATVPGSAAADVLGALADAGISDPTRSELASTSHVTPGLVNRIAERCRERGKGAGAMVLDIRAAAAKAARDAERKRQRREAERQVLADIEQQTADMATGAQREAGLAKMAEALGRRSRGIV